jgi:hypothetical protein
MLALGPQYDDSETPLAPVLIEWLDIVGVDSAWLSRDDLESLEPTLMVTAGWVLKETEEFLVIAGTLEVGGDLQVGNVNCIPKSVVVSRKPLVTFGG